MGVHDFLFGDLINQGQYSYIHRIGTNTTESLLYGI